MEIKENSIIKLDLNDKNVKIINQIGEGGQGQVFKVELDGKFYALKWYTKSPKKSFYDNLKTNVDKGAPNKHFLWPLFLTKKSKEGEFGYIMELRPPEFEEFSQFLLAKVRFSDVTAIINAAIKICQGFRALHNKGYSYQDVNDGNFFINPQNGDVLICDNDNVAPFGSNTGIIGKCRYMAPEVVNGSKQPDTQSDRFSLSVILFLLFFGNHPLEGRKITSCPCLTEEHEKQLYGNQAVFIYDSKDDSNRPVQGIHRNVINRWGIYPAFVKEMFSKAFSKKALLSPDHRILEKEWLDKVLLPLYQNLTRCNCGELTFVNTELKSYDCMECKKTHTMPPVLKLNKTSTVLVKDKKVQKYLLNIADEPSPDTDMAGIVVESSKHPGIYGLQNLSKNTWILTLKDGTQRNVVFDKIAPLLKGNKINFGNGTVAEVV